MDDASLRLDGNAVGGLLREIFVHELTAARTTCASCGAVAEVGALLAYVHAPGTVLRCRGCDSVQIRIVGADGRFWLDVRGASCLELRPEP